MISGIFTIVLILVAGVLVAFSYSNAFKIQELRDEINRSHEILQAELENLRENLSYYQDLFFKAQEENKRLQAQLEDLQAKQGSSPITGPPA